MPGKLSLPKATASTVINKPRGPDVPPTSTQEIKHPERPSTSDEPQLSTALVHVKSHAQSLKKGKKECAPRNALGNIPGYLKARYIEDFQPAFVHASITISTDPWEKLPAEDVQALFSAVFPEVNHEIVFGDMFHSPARQQASLIRNHVKEAALTAVHRAMENLAPGARKHQAAKAEKHKKEFPFIYRYHEVTDIPDRHAEGGEAVRREGPWLAPTICETLVA